MNIRIVPISKSIDRKNFKCGIDDLDRYLKQFAVLNDRNNIGKTFVAIESSHPQKPIGYYTVSMAQILFKNLPDSIRKGLPKYPVPAMRIGKLAVDSRFKGLHIGSFLLKDAFLRAINISSEIALYFVLVDALNEDARNFYLKYGFTAFENNPLTLVIPLATIKKAVSV